MMAPSLHPPPLSSHQPFSGGGGGVSGSESASSGDNPLYNPLHDSTRYMYARNSKAIGVLWAVFSLCFAIINMVVFVQPQWLGDTATSRGTGYFGLWRSCRLLQDGQDLICEGRLDDWIGLGGSGPASGSIAQFPAAFRAATVFVGLSVAISSLVVVTMVLFFFMHSSTVFHVCGWMQLACAISMLVGVLVFPIGWDTPMVREVCGADSDSYSIGQCGIRWAFILAIIGVVDCLVLSILAFVLGSRYVKLLPDHYLPNGTKYKGEVNCGFMNGSENYMSNKKLIASHLHPQLGGGGGGGMAGKLHSHHHLHSHLGAITTTTTSNSYLSPFGSSSHNHHLHHHHQTAAPPPPPLLPPMLPPPPTHALNSANSQGVVTTSTLTDVERFSEYSSHRTSRRSSSYKSSPPGSSGGGGGGGGGSGSGLVVASSAGHNHFSNF